MNDDQSMTGMSEIHPRHEAIFKVGLEVAEMDWLRALDRGFSDPVIELTERPPTPICARFHLYMRWSSPESNVCGAN